MTEFFKGYVPTKDKKCLMKFKDAKPSDLLKIEEVINLPEYAGILAENTVLIDIDDMEQSEIMMRIVEDQELLCRVYQTNHGMHFLFHNNGMFDRCRTKVNLACGIKADIKLGLANSYEVLKYKGEERKIVYDILDDEEYSPAPRFLTPVPSKLDFFSLKEGDGRNQTLFNYILTLQGSDFSKEDARESIKILNQYVLPESLDDSELETILRDDSFKKPVFFRGKTFLFDKFARFIKSEYNVIRINGQLHVFDGCIYRSGEREIEEKMLNHIPDLSRSKRMEVLSYLEVIAKKEVEQAPAKYIAFRNGIYDVETDKMMDFSPSIVITNLINYDYSPTAYDALCDKTLDKMSCFDPDIRALLEEAAGYCFYRRNEMRKAFILTGESGQNGKSTYLSIVDKMLGKENITSLDIQELNKTFKNAQLAGKLANIGDDIGDEFIPSAAVFKKLVSGDPINVERKGKDPFDFYNYSKLLFSANNIPRMGKGKDAAAIKSRLIIIPFDAQFTPMDEDYDPYIKYKLTSQQSIEYLIRIGVEGLKRVLSRNGFTRSERVERQIKEYEESNNPILLFFEECPKILNEQSGKVFQNYRVFCNMNGFTPVSQIVFTKSIKKHFGCDVIVKKVNGKSYRIFEKSNGASERKE